MPAAARSTTHHARERAIHNTSYVYLTVLFVRTAPNIPIAYHFQHIHPSPERIKYNWLSIVNSNKWIDSTGTAGIFTRYLKD